MRRLARRAAQLKTDLEGILALAFSQDSKTLVTIGRPNEIRIWDVVAGKLTRTLEIDEMAHLAALDREARMAATVIYVENGNRYTARDIKIWRTDTGKEVAHLKGPPIDVTAIALAPDGMTLASGCEDGSIRIWDIMRGKQIVEFDAHSKSITSLTYADDGRLLASGSKDKSAKIWRIEAR